MISFSSATIAKQVTAKTVTASEVDMLTITDKRFLQNSQFSVYVDSTVGSQKIYLRYYHSFDSGSTWYQVPVKDLATTKGELVNLPSIIDSSSPAKLVEDIAVTGSSAFKITAQTDANTATINVLTLVTRDN